MIVIWINKTQQLQGTFCSQALFLFLTINLFVQFLSSLVRLSYAMRGIIFSLLVSFSFSVFVFGYSLVLCRMKLTAQLTEVNSQKLTAFNSLGAEDYVAYVWFSLGFMTDSIPHKFSICLSSTQMQLFKSSLIYSFFPQLLFVRFSVAIMGIMGTYVTHWKSGLLSIYGILRKDDLSFCFLCLKEINNCK